MKQTQLEKIHKAAREGRIVIADQTNVTRYAYETQCVLNFFGHPEALVTDESRVLDFLGGAKKGQPWRRGFANYFHVPLPAVNPFIWELAHAIYNERTKGVKNASA